MYTTKIVLAGLIAISMKDGTATVVLPDVDPYEYSQQGFSVPQHEALLLVLKADLKDPLVQCDEVGGESVQPTPSFGDTCQFKFDGGELTVEATKAADDVIPDPPSLVPKMTDLQDSDTFNSASIKLHPGAALPFHSLSRCDVISEYTLAGEKLECGYEFRLPGSKPTGAAGQPLAAAVLLTLMTTDEPVLKISDRDNGPDLAIQLGQAPKRDNVFEVAVKNHPVDHHGDWRHSVFDPHFLVYQDLAKVPAEILRRKIPFRTSCVHSSETCSSVFWQDCLAEVRKVIGIMKSGEYRSARKEDPGEDREDDYEEDQGPPVNRMLGDLVSTCEGPPICPLAIFKSE